MYPMGTITAAEHPIVPSDINQTQITNPYSAPFIEYVLIYSINYFNTNIEHVVKQSNIVFMSMLKMSPIQTAFSLIVYDLVDLVLLFFSRPSVFSNSHHQHQQYSTIVNPELPISDSSVLHWPPTPSTSQHIHVQQTSFNSLNVPQTGVPWKCPEWMANQTIQPGSYMNFIGQQQSRLPFKRKAAPDLDM